MVCSIHSIILGDTNNRLFKAVRSVRLTEIERIIGKHNKFDLVNGVLAKAIEQYVESEMERAVEIHHNKMTKRYEQYVIKELETAKGKIALAHYHTGKLDFSWIDHKVAEYKKGLK